MNKRQKDKGRERKGDEEGRKQQLAVEWGHHNMRRCIKGPQHWEG